jgi:hypothetical protein
MARERFPTTPRTQCCVPMPATVGYLCEFGWSGDERASKPCTKDCRSNPDPKNDGNRVVGAYVVLLLFDES